MARIGPNQDINDPTTIIDVTYQYQQKSDDFGDLLAQSIAEDPNATGSPVINVSVPFKMEDGSTQFLQGSDIDYDEGYVYDTTLVSNATILTYVDLAERFRDYWETLNSILDQVNNFYYLQEIDVSPTGPTSGVWPPSTLRIHGSLGGTEYTKWFYSYLPIESQSTPLWTGDGPTDYNQITYPQLLSELSNIDLDRDETEISSWETTYWYDQSTDRLETVRGASTGFGKYESFIAPNGQQYIQIYNDEPDSINISLSINISATFDTRFSTSYFSWAEIDDINSYPTPFGGFKNLLSSYISHSEEKLAPGGTISLSTTRIIEIPSGKSAFIGARAGAGTTFGNDITVGIINITIVLNDQTLTHLTNVA